MYSKDKNNAISDLITHSTPRQDFFLFLIFSVCMSTIGLLQNNVAIIIGSMLIAPVLYPILGIAMGTVMANKLLIFRSVRTFFSSFILAIGAGALVTLFFHIPANGDFFELTPELYLRITPTLADAAVAVIAGLAASFALVKPQLSESLPGVAISVALVPPLAAVGIGITQLDLAIITGALIQFLINTLGILFACVTVFSLMNFYVKSDIAEEVIKEEDKELKKINGKK
ncbi:TIGR00341 family protein [Candidatus Peregrinibacteria bacterium]|nr:TIGR00341 family protein [Candidatus Peregrinibacteria bacterium]